MKNPLVFSFKHVAFGLAATSCFIAKTGAAQSTPSAASGIDFSGTVDLYYSYNANRPEVVRAPLAGADNQYAQQSGLPAGQNKFRSFDLRHNAITVNLVELSFKKTQGDVSARVDLDFGDTADVTSASGSGTDSVGKHVGQAIVSYAPSNIKGLVFNVGKMATHLGLEVIKSKDNWQYSRSLLFAIGLPYWHNGLNIAYAIVPETVSVGFYAYNGWNNSYETNRGKSLGWQLAINPSKNISLVYNGISGPEQASNEKNLRTIHELNGTLTFSENFALAFDAISGSEAKAYIGKDGKTKTAHWQAAQLAAKIGPTSRFYISPRIEGYWDKEGYTTSGFSAGGDMVVLRSYTLTAAVKTANALETRLEARQDVADKATFTNHKGNVVKTQSTFTLATIYSI